MLTERSTKQALVILVGITADKMKRGNVYRAFSQRTLYDVFLPELPQRLGVRWSAWWLHRYLEKTVRIQQYSRVHFFNYISGGVVFRYVATRWPIPNAGRVVYDRGPIQEEVPRALVKRYGRLVLCISRGKMLTDLAGDWLERLPFPRSLEEQGLVVETGISSVAQSLGISSEGVPAETWNPERLLPGASDVIKVTESHDEVYTSPRYLSTVRSFLQHGRFNAPEVP